MSDLLVTERRLRPIQDAVASKNWKQAWSLCDKWHKRGEASDQFLALRAYVLLHQSDARQHEKGIADVKQLCERTPAVTSADALHQLQDALQELSLQNEYGPKLWDRAVAASPADKDLLMTWLDRSIAESHWLSAQKATMALRKAFPKERKYDFWNILMCYLIHRDNSLPEKDRKLFGTLAYRLACKAAEAVPEDKKQLLSPGKALQTPEELQLLVMVYVSTGNGSEAVSWLLGDRLGLSSRFAEQDAQLVRSLLFETFEVAQLWKIGLQFYTEQLSKEPTARMIPDTDQLWTHMTRLLPKCKDLTAQIQEVDKLVDIQLQAQSPLPSLYHARMAMLSWSASTSQDSSEKLLDICRRYFQVYKSKTFCFNDMRIAMSALMQENLKELVKLVQSDSQGDGADDAAEKVPRGIRSLLGIKMQYCFDLWSQVDHARVTTFATEAMQLYQSSIRGEFLLPEAGLLAAFALIKLAFHGDTAGTQCCKLLMQAAIIIEACRSSAEDFYPYLVLLVRLRIVLGQPSLAMMSFRRLSIKNVQWESVGHLLLTRMSTLHPQQYGRMSPDEEDSSFSPLEALDAALTVAENAEKTLTRQIREGLNYSSYGNIAEAVEAKRNFKYSLNQKIFEIEHLRIRRLTGMLDDSDIDISISPESLVDMRDYSYLPNYDDVSMSGKDKEPFVPGLTACLGCGPLPTGMWCNAMSVYDKTFHFLKGETDKRPDGEPRLLDLQKAIEICETAGLESYPSVLTVTELENMYLHLSCAKCVADTEKDPLSSSDPPTTEKSLHAIEQWLQHRLGDKDETIPGLIQMPDVQIPTFAYLHHEFSVLESLQLLSLFTAYLTKKTKGTGKSKTASSSTVVSKERIEAMRKMASDVETRIRERAKKIKTGLNEAGVLGKLVDICLGQSENDEPEGVGREIGRMCDSARLEVWCGEMKESWEDAVDGVLAVKVKKFK